MKILCDLDNVLNDLTEVWIWWLNYKYNLTYTIEDLKEYDMRKTFTSLTESQIYEPLYDEIFWLRLSPQPDSKKYLKQLIDDGHEIFIATASHHKTVAIKVQWLLNYFPFVKTENIIIAHNKQMINGDILIDDWQDNIIGGNYHGILLDYPWNRDVDLSHDVCIRRKSWQGIYNTINELNKP